MHKTANNSRKKMGKLIILLLLVLLTTSGTAFTEELPLMKIQEVTDLIMSPGCNYNYTLSLCPSSEAAQMRELVKDKILRGESRDQILSYFEQVYGPRILAQPARKGFYFVAWWFPYFLLFDAFVLVGVILYVWRKRAMKNLESTGVASSEMNIKADAELDEILEGEVRRMREG
jgi:cytochrome c-type biogenesis protein CcmH